MTAWALVGAALLSGVGCDKECNGHPVDDGIRTLGSRSGHFVLDVPKATPAIHCEGEFTVGAPDQSILSLTDYAGAGSVPPNPPYLRFTLYGGPMLQRCGGIDGVSFTFMGPKQVGETTLGSAVASFSISRRTDLSSAMHVDLRGSLRLDQYSNDCAEFSPGELCAATAAGRAVVIGVDASGATTASLTLDFSVENGRGCGESPSK